MAPLSAIVASAFIGAVATGVVTLGVRELRGGLNTQRRRERLRDALIGEIESGVGNAGAAEIVTEAGTGMIPTSVFDNNTTELGLLTSQEIQRVTEYYGSAGRINGIAERVALNPEEGDDPELDKETQLAKAYYSERDFLIEKGDKAIGVLSENKSETGLRAYLFGSSDDGEKKN